MLTSERLIRLTREVILGQPSTARTAAEWEYVRKVKADVAAIKAEGLIPDVPSEWV